MALVHLCNLGELNANMRFSHYRIIYSLFVTAIALFFTLQLQKTSRDRRVCSIYSPPAFIALVINGYSTVSYITLFFFIFSLPKPCHKHLTLRDLCTRMRFTVIITKQLVNQ